MLGKGRALGVEEKVEPDADIEETVESKARRALIGLAFLVGALSWAKIQFEDELNTLQAGIRSYSPDAADVFSQVVWGDNVAKSVKKGSSLPQRRKLDGLFAQHLADCILITALSSKVILDKAVQIRDERALATKAVSFFASARTTEIKPDWIGVWDSEPLANAALYARLRTLSPNLPSPLSRKTFLRALGNRVLADGLLGPGVGLNPAAASDPLLESDKWVAGLRGILAAYERLGYGVCSLGQKGAGELDRERWEEAGEGAITIFVQNLALIDAALVLAGESLNDLAAALLPTCVVTAYLERCGVACDAEDYYLSSAYTRNPAEYRPDSLLIQCNLSVSKERAARPPPPPQQL